MALKSDEKFKEKPTFGFKHDMRNLVNFYSTTQEYENLTLMGSFCPKYIRFELKRYRVICDDTEQWWKVWGKLWPCGFKNGIGWTLKSLKGLKHCI